MSAFAEIEAAVAALSSAELVALERRMHEMNLARRVEGKVFTGDDAVAWWREREHMPLDEGEAFARDVEASRGARGERADTQERRVTRWRFIADVEARYPLLSFGREEGIEYSALWAELSVRGSLIGTHDLLIAAIARRSGCRLATLNIAEFRRVPHLEVMDATSFRLQRP